MKNLTPILLALLLFMCFAAKASAETWVYPGNTPESTAKHIATGALIGYFAADTCGDLLDINEPGNDDEGDRFVCASLTLIGGFGAYHIKEWRDSKKYGDGLTIDGSDVFEGVGGMGIGVGFKLIQWNF